MKTRQTFNVKKTSYNSVVNYENKFSDRYYVTGNEMYTKFLILRTTL